MLRVDRPRFNSLTESGQKTLKVGIHSMGVGSGEQGRGPPWIFIDGTDKIEGSLIVLFFCLDFTVGPTPPESFFTDALDSHLPCLMFSIKMDSVKVGRASSLVASLGKELNGIASTFAWLDL